MKKYFFLVIIVTLSLVLAYCSHTKKAAATKEPPKSTFVSGVSILIMNNCSPCHIPAKGGNKRAYDNFTNVKADIDEIIFRIEMNPGQRGFMPAKKPKLSDSTIAVFKQWKADGLLEQ